MAEDNSSPDRIEQIDKRLDYLESIARETIARLYAIEMHLGIARRPAEASPPVPQILQPETEKAPTPPPATITPAPELAAPPQAPLPRPRVIGAPVPQGPPPAQAHARQASGARKSTPPVEQARSKSRGDLEARIGGNWFNRIGIIAISFGVAFFLKYAFDNQWIGPWGRVMIGVVIGLAFLIAGERLRQRYQNYAYGLTGGGILILYLSIYAAYAFFTEPLIGQMPAFVCMAVVTATASLLAARYSALPIAFLGFIGGFLTPLLLSTGVDNEVGLFGYIALLDVGVFTLAYSKQWRSLNYSAFVATVLMIAGWMLEWYAPEKLWTTIFFLTLFFIIFALLAVLYNVVNRRPTIWVDLALVFANALLYFGASYQLLEDWYRGALGLFAVLVSAFYLALGFFTYNRDREDKFLVYTFLGLAFLFLVLAVPIQFNQHWVTMGWAIEGAVMTWIGLRVNDRTSRYAALAVFIIAVSHWAMIDVHDFAYQANETFVPLLNRRAISCAVLVAAFAAAASFYKRSGSEVEPDERSMFTGLYILGANILAVTLLSLDANDYFKQVSERAGAAGGFGGPERSRQINNAHQLTLSALWTVYGATALIVGVMRRLKPLRVAAAVLLAVTIAKVLVIDSAYYNAPWHAAIFNQTFAAFALLILALSASAWFYAQAKGIDESERALALRVLIAGANLLAVVALSLEVYGHFARKEATLRALPGQATGLADIESTKQLALTALWTMYAAVVLILGIARKSKSLRWGALCLLTLTTLKVIAVDLSYYDAPWHTLIFNQTFAAFALVIVVMIMGIWFYSRAEGVDEQERSIIIPVLVAAANFLAILALSAEAYGYYAKSIEASAASATDLRDLRLAQQLSLSVIWTVYGGAMLVAGIARRNRMLRMMGLGLLGLTTVKVFLLDLSSLEKVYRIVSFIVLGAILLAVSFLYQRYRQRMAELIDDTDAEPPLNDAPLNME